MEQAAAPAAYRVLARKYRPTRLSELVGQDALVATLRNALASGRIAHAFLLSGIRGIGKTTTARIIARALNCTGPDGTGGPNPEPCGACASCLAIEEGRAMDVIEMDAATRTGIDDIREIVDSVRYAPSSSRFKVYIIDEVHMLSEKAFNGLLKTLEEPPPHAKFIFATTEVRKVPVTVLSRCQRFDLRRFDQGVLEGHLAEICRREGVTAEPEALRLIAIAAEGSARDGLSLLDQAIALSEQRVDAGTVQGMLGLGDRGRILGLFEAVLEGETAAVLERFVDLHALGADPAAVLQDLLGLSHRLSRQRAGGEVGDAGFMLGPDLEARAAALAARASLPELTRAWQMLLKGLGEVRVAPDAAAAAEMVLLRIASAQAVPPPGELTRLLSEVAGGPSGQPAPVAGSRQPEPAAMQHHAEPLAVARTLADAPAACASADTPDCASFEALLELLKRGGERPLAAYLEEGAHLVRFAPGAVEFRPATGMPADVASRLRAAASRLSGRPWNVTLAETGGSPTLAQQRAAARAERIDELRREPAVRRVLETYPGADILELRTPAPDERLPAGPPGDRETSEVGRR